MIVDELILKLQADLADVKKGLAQVKVDAEKTGKEAGANMGKAAGKGFDSSLKSDVDKTLKDVQGKAESSGSALSGIFGKIGGAIAGAFALDKVVKFFSSAMDEAKKLDEELGTVSERTKQIDEDFDNLSKSQTGIWSKIKVSIGSVLNSIVTNLKEATVAVVEFFTGQDPDRIVKVYQRTRDNLQAIGGELDRLSGIQKRTAEEELQFIKLKDELSSKLEKLGISYNDAAKGARNYSEAVQKAVNLERRKAQARLYEQSQAVLQSPRALENFENREELEQLKRSGNGLSQRARYLAVEIKEYNAEQERRKKLSAELRLKAENIDKEAEKEKSSPVSSVGKDTGNEARFLDSALRLKTIQNDLEFTIRKAEQAFRKGKIDQAEFERIAGKNGVGGTAREEARQATEFELGSLRQGYAQFIEDNHAAKMEAIKAEADNARRLSNNLLEAELDEAWGNEEELQELREANAKRLAEIDKAEVRKTAMQYAQSFQQTMQAAQATTTGIAQLAKAKDIGSSLSAQGNVLQGISGFKDLAPSLGVLGPIGAGIGALGGIFSTIMGDSEAKAAERARQQAERDAAALKTLQSQEKYAKDLLEFQKAQANLPFKDLQRELRIIDIQTQQKRLQGTPGDQAELERMQRTSGAIGNVLQQQADKFTGGVFFNNSARSAEALSSALGDVDRYSPSMNLLSSIMSEVAATRGESAEKIGYDFYNTRLAKVASLDLPPQLKQAAMDFITSVAAAGFYRVARDNGINNDEDLVLARLGKRSSYGADIFRAARGYESALGGRGINTSTVNVDNMLSEFQADAGMIENLLGLFEKLNQTNLQIQDNTKKTADNTAKALELRPDRERSFIDVGLGFIQSLGQRISPSAIGIAQGIARQNLTLPTSIGTATATSSLARTLQERMADAMEIQVAQGERANQLLDGILRATIELYRVMDGNSGTVSTFDDAAATAYLADRKRRAY